MDVKEQNIAGSSFEIVDLSKARFENVNLSGSRFHDINFSDVEFTAAQIGGSTFRHIGPPPQSGARQRPVTFEEGILAGSSFRRVDLTNVKIEQCQMEGMTIDGIAVSDLLAAYRKTR
jgi:uncharacterized protein YjbI with pentapeptide repeats